MLLPSKITIILALTLSFYSCSTSSKKSSELAKADLFYSEGTKLLGEKNYREALDKLLTASQLDPSNPDIHNNLGMTYYFLNKEEDAINHFKTAAELDPKYTRALSNLATIYQTQKKYTEALKIHNQALKDLIFNERYRTYYNMALIYFQTEEPLEAIKYLTLSLRENEYYCPANFKMGEWEEKKMSYDKALDFYLKASNGTCYQEPAPIYQQGLMLMKLRRYESAISKFDNVIGRFTDSKYSTLASLRKREILATANNNLNQAPSF